MTFRSDIKFTFDTRKLDRLARELRKIPIDVAQVGIFGGEPHKNAEGLTVATVAAINEFGSEEQNIPERPFIQVTALTSKFHVPMSQGFKSVLAGTGTTRQMIVKSAKKMTQDMKEVIEGFSIPPNSETTIEKKGFDNPLIETRQMQRSIRHRIKKR